MSEQPLDIVEYITANQQLARQLVEARDEVDRLRADLADAQRERDELAALLAEQIRLTGRRNPKPATSSGRAADTERRQG